MTAMGLGVIPHGSPSTPGQGYAPRSFRALAQLCREGCIPVPTTGLDSGMGHVPLQKSNKEVGFGVLPLGNELERSWLVRVEGSWSLGQWAQGVLEGILLYSHTVSCSPWEP